MQLIIGLGNPGKEYETTRHNVGFLAIDFFRNHWNFSDWVDAPKFKGLISEGISKEDISSAKILKGEKTILLRPMTYMNLSGESVAAVANFYKIPPENILVISDDIDMEFGKIRYREKGSSGGQNGLKSIAKLLGTEAFPRLKIGIGRDPKFDVADWVLSKFKKEEMDALEKEIFPSILG